MSSSNNGAAGTPLGERLVSEPVEPVPGSFDQAAMAAGEPGVPSAFVWRGKTYRVEAVLEAKKTFRDCRSGSGERYVNKHYATVRTDSGDEMTLYRTRSASKKDSWILYTIRENTP